MLQRQCECLAILMSPDTVSANDSAGTEKSEPFLAIFHIHPAYSASLKTALLMYESFLLMSMLGNQVILNIYFLWKKINLGLHIGPSFSFGAYMTGEIYI